MLPRVLGGVLLTAIAVAGCGGRTADRTAAPSGAGTHLVARGVSSQSRLPLTVSPSVGGKHDRFAVAMTSRRAAGVVGQTRRGYTVEAHAVRPASGCVNNRDRRFPDRLAGARVRAELDPARGEGGPEGWCPGAFRGTVTYFEAFACPRAGICHPPNGFPAQTHIVARFFFRVR